MSTPRRAESSRSPRQERTLLAIESNIAPPEGRNFQGTALKVLFFFSVNGNKNHELKARSTPYPAEAGHSSAGGAGMKSKLARWYEQFHN